MNSQYIDIIILVAIAIFFIIKLGKSLGTRPDGLENKDKRQKTEEEDKKDFSTVSKEEETSESAKIIDISRFKEAEQGVGVATLRESGDLNSSENKLKTVFYKIYSRDKSFHPDTFLEGAKSAFLMIIEAFSTDDEDTLKSLVDSKVFARFKQALDAYKAKNQKIEQTLIGFKEVKIEDAMIEENTAKIIVYFDSEQAKVVKDDKDKVIEGDSVMISRVKDVWTFAKDLTNSSPDWILTSVKAG